ncbi:MAG: DNA-deoxyinosine glycosylase [Bacillota bacterium]|nr:DNA-deoxyinosine glycosylase [Bacillota bacterium]
MSRPVHGNLKYGGVALGDVRSFGPVVDENSRVLILGSMPGEESLRKQQYYANPRNQFWPIIYAIFGLKPDVSYDKRINFVLSKGIALWDVIERCERKGSLDSNIRNEKPNNIKELLKAYQNIRLVVFNGIKAYKTYRKNIGFGQADGIIYKRLPSTSPVPGKNIKSLTEKVKDWKIISEFLNK